MAAMVQAKLQERDDAARRVALRVVPGHGGGPPPMWSQPPISSPQLAILVVIAFETMLFAGLVSAYVVLRNSHLSWPPPDLPRLPLAITWLNTGVLLASAATMFAAVRSLAAGRDGAFRNQLVLTAALGSLFLVVQGSEWARLIAQGLTLTVHVYGAIFYSVIGLHALHVVVAVAWLAVVTALAWRGRYDASDHVAVDVCATYWYFVCGLWLLLFALIYLY